MKSIIYTQRVEIIECYKERRDCADQRIAEYIFQNGFLPVPVPNNKTIVEGIVKKIQPGGIILTGGNSLTIYGGNAPERDETDDFLIDYAVKNHIPLYGFCRGMQSILHYFGNSLEEVSGHVAVHHKIIGDIGVCEVNSYHNQACLKLCEDSELDVIAQAEDGVIEAVKHSKFPIIGTMWHPEREETARKIDIQLMKGLFEL